MQRQYSASDSFPETIGMEQRSVPNSVGMSQQSSMNNMLNPVENRLSNDAVSYDEASCVNAITHDVQSLNGWSLGESSSRMNLQNQALDDSMKMEERRPSSFNPHTVAVPRSDERRFETNDIFMPGRVSIGISGSEGRNGQVLLQGSSSSTVLSNPNPTRGYVGDSSNGRHGMGNILGSNHFNSRGLNFERVSPGTSNNNVGTSESYGFMTDETDGGPGSSIGGWGLSCKRKSLEGTSGHSYPGGSSSCFPHPEHSAWNTGTNRNASSSLSLSPPSWNSLSVSPPEQSNTRTSYDVTGNADPSRDFRQRVNSSHQQEPLALNFSTPGGARRPNFWPMHQSLRPVPLSDPLDFRTTPATNPSASQGPPHAMHASASSRNTYLFPWYGSSTSRARHSSSSHIPGERGAALHDEASLRSISRNNIEHSMFMPVTEMRNMGQDPSGWSLATGNISSPSSVSSNRQRFLDFSPWSLFPSMDSEPSGRNGHFPSSSGPSASSQETVLSSGSGSQGHNQPFQRSAFLVEGQSDDVLGMPRSLRALAADIEGRHQLISEVRQVLNAMRRGENLRMEDYMLFDPFTHHSMAEMHDRHRDMRLDVDNMSYEELLALEERIGDVNTGLNEGTILKLLKQQKYAAMTAETADIEPCSICQEVYKDGDDFGRLDCGHDFHTNCIKQWLALKNICPICKMTALPT
ncbi:E3 ubiquitin-protein ligase MBR2-like isoform X2 [Mercurialis annua]|uniref:E3 ubiquitin-protein ligase MBR2-like isoform X2 n=1 Tax=Mercurialis annua TaxID=3986 RepID=UPI00215FC57A|nr:E3 ubiquitin-protein ligase MBR2-like isoform X2 [Mercurialis annua]